MFRNLKILIIVLFSLFGMFLLLNFQYASAKELTNDEYLEVINRIDRIEIKLSEWEKNFNDYSNNLKDLRTELNAFENNQIKYSSDLSSLKDDIQKSREMIYERYDSKIMTLEWIRSIIDILIVVAGIIIGFFGLNSISDYRKRVIKEKLEKELTSQIVLEVQSSVEKTVKKDMFDSYSSDIGKLSSRLEMLEKYRDVLEILKDMGGKNAKAED